MQKVHPPVSGTVRLVTPPVADCTLIPGGRPGVVVINGTPYSLAYFTHLEDDGLNIVTGYRLTKADGTNYDLPDTLDACECKDWLCRDRADRKCKHLKALRKLVDLGLIAN